MLRESLVFVGTYTETEGSQSEGRSASKPYAERGREPRNFAIDPSGSFLLVANQKTNNIVTFKIDRESGGLSRIEHEVKVSMPVCLKFASL